MIQEIRSKRWINPKLEVGLYLLLLERKEDGFGITVDMVTDLQNGCLSVASIERSTQRARLTSVDQNDLVIDLFVI